MLFLFLFAFSSARGRPVGTEADSSTPPTQNLRRLRTKFSFATSLSLLDDWTPKPVSVLLTTPRPTPGFSLYSPSIVVKARHPRLFGFPFKSFRAPDRPSGFLFHWEDPCTPIYRVRKRDLICFRRCRFLAFRALDPLSCPEIMLLQESIVPFPRVQGITLRSNFQFLKHRLHPLLHETRFVRMNRGAGPRLDCFI